MIIDSIDLISSYSKLIFTNQRYHHHYHSTQRWAIYPLRLSDRDGSSGEAKRRPGPLPIYISENTTELRLRRRPVSYRLLWLLLDLPHLAVYRRTNRRLNRLVFLRAAVGEDNGGVLPLFHHAFSLYNLMKGLCGVVWREEGGFIRKRSVEQSRAEQRSLVQPLGSVWVEKRRLWTDFTMGGIL